MRCWPFLSFWWSIFIVTNLNKTDTQASFLAFACLGRWRGYPLTCTSSLLTWSRSCQTTTGVNNHSTHLRGRQECWTVALRSISDIWSHSFLFLSSLTDCPSSLSLSEQCFFQWDINTGRRWHRQRLWCGGQSPNVSFACICMRLIHSSRTLKVQN